MFVEEKKMDVETRLNRLEKLLSMVVRANLYGTTLNTIKEVIAVQAPSVDTSNFMSPVPGNIDNIQKALLAMVVCSGSG